MSKTKNQLTVPRSMRHKQILEAAADHPDASLETISSKIPTATPDLVERVLDEYGDPAKDQSDTSFEELDGSSRQDDMLPHPNDLSPKEYELLRMIFEHPQASQRELGKKLDVSRTTISNRANSIEGFDWDNRQTFVEAMFETELTETSEVVSQISPNDTENQPTKDHLLERINEIEKHVEDLIGPNESCSAFEDPELIHKIIHASMKSETITEDEELQILKAIL